MTRRTWMQPLKNIGSLAAIVLFLVAGAGCWAPAINHPASEAKPAELQQEMSISEKAYAQQMVDINKPVIQAREQLVKMVQVEGVSLDELAKPGPMQDRAMEYLDVMEAGYDQASALSGVPSSIQRVHELWLEGMRQYQSAARGLRRNLETDDAASLVQFQEGMQAGDAALAKMRTELGK